MLLISFLLATQSVFAQQRTTTADDSIKIAEKQKAEAWANFQKAVEERYHKDWAWISRYQTDNDRLPAPTVGEKRVVFIGNSITEGWMNIDPEYFKSHGYINRGIGGQTTPQMLVRFREDVINLKPSAVVILAGINDIAENTGPSRLTDVFGNIVSMAELAKANHIRVILSSVLPAYSFPWRPDINPRAKVAELNAMLAGYAKQNGFSYINYYSAMVNDVQGMRDGLSTDGVHPNLAGYKIMEPLAEQAIQQTLHKH
ncbi:SGNH/GDSL hydrolase family protein [Mucilaginibacter koreensis]